MPKIIEEWIKERIISASEMPATQLVNSYRDSFEIKDNPLSKLYENEILRRLWVSERSNMQT
jgi:hypothetical protein